MTKFLIIIGAISLFILSLSGCANPMSGGGFADERYVWEDWTVSTNAVNVNTNVIYIAE